MTLRAYGRTPTVCYISFVEITVPSFWPKILKITLAEVRTIMSNSSMQGNHHTDNGPPQFDDRSKDAPADNHHHYEALLHICEADLSGLRELILGRSELTFCGRMAVTDMS